MKKIIIFFLFTGIAAAQTKTNLEIFYSLLDSALSQAAYTIPAGSEAAKKTFYFEAGELNSVFYGTAASKMLSLDLGKAAMQESDLIFMVEQTSVVYDDMFRDGMFGSFLMPRELRLQGNYLLVKNNKSQKFDLAFRDTVSVDHVESIENEMYPFTRGKVPAEPFLSSILEPAIAIGVTALAVILFFSVRSK